MADCPVKNGSIKSSSWKALSDSGLEVDRVLGQFANGQRMVFLCKGNNATDDKQAVCVFEKLPIIEANVKQLFLNSGDASSALSLLHENDIYATFRLNPPSFSSLSSLKTTVIYPATPQHIMKYAAEPMKLVTETAAIYNNVTKSYIAEKKLSLQWVQNILYGTAEADKVLLNTGDSENGFVVLPDMRWDGSTDPSNCLYLIAIAKDPNLSSLRDVTPKHLPLLRSINDAVTSLVFQKFGITSDNLRIFVHYPPSYWHFHVHIVVAPVFDSESPRPWLTERTHWLASIIDNVDAFPTFYQRSTLIYVLKQRDDLYRRISEIAKQSDSSSSAKLARLE